MISEHKLASAYSSFWRVTLPFSDTFVRRMNLSTMPFAHRYELSVPPERAALVSEMSFRFLGIESSNPSKVIADSVSLEAAAQAAWVYISRFPDSGALSPPSGVDMADALALSARLKEFFQVHEPGKELLLNPHFQGCGLVDDCVGDVIVGNTLYEVKNVDRGFRVTDIRQLIAYCALNAAKPRYRIESVGLINGRSGRFYQSDLNALAIGMTGSTASVLLADVIAFISSEQASR